MYFGIAIPDRGPAAVMLSDQTLFETSAPGQPGMAAHAPRRCGDLLWCPRSSPVLRRTSSLTSSLAHRPSVVAHAKCLTRQFRADVDEASFAETGLDASELS